MARLGIVGGGQLAHFLCLAARRLGVATVVWSGSPRCPAARSADRVLVGPPDDPGTAAALCACSDVITFETEAVPAEVLTLLGRRAAAGHVEAAPAPGLMLVLSDKGLQKQWLVRHGHPTAAFEHLPGGPPDAEALVARFGLPLVQKSATGSYGGRNVQIIRYRSQLARLWRTPSVVEAFVTAVAEVAVVVARGADGTTATYEPVWLDMDRATQVLRTAVSPAPIEAALRRRIQRLGVDVVTDLGGVGVFTVETFVTDSGSVLVNEISPRVHNAGHLTLEAAETSQFEQHLRAVLGRPLGGARQRVANSVMHNVLYEPPLHRLHGVAGFDRVDSHTATAAHWYGKSGGRRGRKMGHVTAWGGSATAARRRADAALRGAFEGFPPLRVEEASP